MQPIGQQQAEVTGTPPVPVRPLEVTPVIHESPFAGRARGTQPPATVAPERARTEPDDDQEKLG